MSLHVVSRTLYAYVPNGRHNERRAGYERGHRRPRLGDDRRRAVRGSDDLGTGSGRRGTRGAGNDGIETGWDGLEELKRLADLADDGVVDLEYVGERPDAIERGHASEGEIDALIRDLAEDLEATFLTSDIVRRSRGGERTRRPPRLPESRDVGTLAVEEFFDETTMSVHLKTDAVPMAKRGELGEMRYEELADEPIDEETMDEYAREVVDGAGGRRRVHRTRSRG